MKKFFVLWSSQAASLLGSALVDFSLAWYLTRETGSATILATALMVAMIPPIVLGPFTGPLIDRWSRKKIMIISDAFISLLTVVLVVLFYTKTIQIWHIYVVLIGRTAGGTFQNPALGASIPMIVPEKQLVRANGLYQMLQYGIRVISPIAGAFFLEIFPMYGVLSIDIITAVIAIACIIPLGIPQPAPPALTIKPNYYNEMKQGFQYILSRRGLVMLIVMITALVFFTAAPANLMPVLVNKHLGGDVVKLGWLGTAGGIGGIAGGMLLGAWGGLKKKIWTAFLGFLIMIPCSVVVGFTSIDIFYSTTLPALLFMGVGNAFVNAPLAAIINSVVAKDFQGRVLSLQTSIVVAAMPLGLVIGGLVADALDIRSLYWIAAAAWLVILPLATLSKSLMNLENEKTEEPTAA